MNDSVIAPRLHRPGVVVTGRLRIQLATGNSLLEIGKMESRKQYATWLELAVAPEWMRGSCKIKVHEVGGRGRPCFAISMNNRWLCAASGCLTVFFGLGSALHFLKLWRIENFEPGEAHIGSVECSDSRHCLSIGGDGSLRRCRANPSK